MSGVSEWIVSESELSEWSGVSGVSEWSGVSGVSEWSE